MAQVKRPHMTLRVQRDAALWALGLDPANVDFHHDPLLAARPINPETGDTIPPANDPRHITPMAREAHKARTPQDIKTVAKVKRLEKKEAEFRAKLLAADKAPPEAKFSNSADMMQWLDEPLPRPKPKRRIPARKDPWPKGRKFQRRAI